MVCTCTPQLHTHLHVVHVHSTCIIHVRTYLPYHKLCFSQVSVGTNINKVLDNRLPFVTAEEGGTLPITIIVPAVVAPVVVIFLCCLIWIAVIICYSRRAGKKKELQYTSLIAKMELLEYNMADECKRGRCCVG